MAKRNSNSAQAAIHALRLEKEKKDREKKEKKALKTQLKMKSGKVLKNRGRRRGLQKLKKEQKMTDDE
jgi:hypothetical protein